ncbi:tol-pal system protein YbgF [Rhodobacteraceae bacterium CCMM004]|nr:tol-pal system protein YbgF [Rhodobacteraceae bacterium CCMM004]
MTLRALILAAALALPTAAAAQDDQTLADIRQELSILFVELQTLKRELSTTGTPSVNLAGTGALERIDAMEAELRRLTARAEELEFRIDSVVSDGTNRIGDLEFRLCELEPDCDIAALGDTPSLGGVEVAPGPAPAPTTPPSGGAELAIGEQADFDRAKEALDSGSFRAAADLFAAFTEAYKGGPLTGQAHFWRGEALTALGETADAARAYLESFSGAPDGPKAPEALLKLGLALGTLGQQADACITLGEVSNRYPTSTAAIEAVNARAQLGCA